MRSNKPTASDHRLSLIAFVPSAYILASSAYPAPSANETSMGVGYSASNLHGAAANPATRKIANSLSAFIRLRLPSRTSARSPDLVCARAAPALRKEFRWYSCLCAPGRDLPPSDGDRLRPPPVPARADPRRPPAQDLLHCSRSHGRAGSKPAVPSPLTAVAHSQLYLRGQHDSAAPAAAPCDQDGPSTRPQQRAVAAERCPRLRADSSCCAPNSGRQ